MQCLNNKVNVHIRIVILICTVTNLFNCSGNDDVSQEIGGDVNGNVILYDLDGVELTDKSGVQVQIKNDKHNYSSSTISDGTFQLKDIPLGEFTITFEKTNFSGMNEFTLVKEKGNSTYTNIRQAQIPNAEITLTSHLAGPGNCYSPIGSIVVTPDNTVSVFYYFSKKQSVSVEDYEWVEWTCCYGTGAFDYTSCDSSLGGMFNTGDKVYVAAYVGNQKLVGDFTLQPFAFPTHNDEPSGTLSFTMP